MIERAYLCTVCGKGYGQLNTLRQHTRMKHPVEADMLFPRPF